jgi:hypothetical protein
MPKKFQTLESWIDEALSDQDKTDGLGNVKPCTALAAVHVSANGVGTKRYELGLRRADDGFQLVGRPMTVRQAQATSKTSAHFSRRSRSYRNRIEQRLHGFGCQTNC